METQKNRFPIAAIFFALLTLSVLLTVFDRVYNYIDYSPSITFSSVRFTIYCVIELIGYGLFTVSLFRKKCEKSLLLASGLLILSILGKFIDNLLFYFGTYQLSFQLSLLIVQYVMTELVNLLTIISLTVIIAAYTQPTPLLKSDNAKKLWGLPCVLSVISSILSIIYDMMWWRVSLSSIITKNLPSYIINALALFLICYWIKSPEVGNSPLPFATSNSAPSVEEKQTQFEKESYKNMDEKVLIKGKANKINAVSIFTTLVGLATLFFFFLSVMMIEDGDSNAALWIIITIILAAITFVLWNTLNCEIVVTDKRIFGKVAFGRRVDLPLDSVSAVATTSSFTHGVSVSTSSGRITFLFLANMDEIASEIRALLIDRQNQTTATTAVKQEISLSNADELRKYKQLLDDGVITQEEFDAKKKQLLGL